MKFSVKRLVLSGLFLAMGFALPQLFHLFGAGSAFSPMHIPVLLCGFVCGAPYGAICGFLLPYLSSAITGMPPLFPMAVAMSLELCAYGALSGLFYRRLNWNVYLALVAAQLIGRAVFGAAMAAMLAASGGSYTFAAFISSAFVSSLPGIILQLVLVPAVVAVLVKTGLITHADQPPRQCKSE